MRGSALCVMTACLLTGLAAKGATTTVVGVRRAALRDLEGYAIASCLVAQDQPYLKDQGDGWASVIVQRWKGDLDALATVAAAVKEELSKGGMAVIRSETGPVPDKPLPVLYCGEIIDLPGVRAAIDKAAARRLR